MAKSVINTGSVANDGTGDTLRAAGVKINDNFSEIYNALGDGSAITLTSTVSELNILDGVTSTAAELNILDGVTSTAAELNILDGLTATTTELNYVDGVTSSIQTQLDSKAASASLATVATSGAYSDLSGTPTIPADVSDLTDTTNLLDNSSRYTFVSGDGTNYTVSGPGIDATNQLDPTLIVYRGHTYKFINNATGHPVEFLNSSDTSAIARIISSTGAAANVAQVGETVTFTVPLDAATGNTYLYRCTVHPSDMLGTITVA